MALIAHCQQAFNLLDLRRKITATLLAAALVIGGLITLVAYFLGYHQLRHHATELLQAHAQLEEREIELRLGAVMSLAESLATNTVTANALADSRGRETYLDPLLRSQSPGIPGAVIGVVDYRGRLAASSKPMAWDFQNHPLFIRMIADERPVAQVLSSENNGSTLLVILPIRYRLTGNVEGGVTLQLPLAPLLGSSQWADSRWLADHDNRLLAGSQPITDVIEVSARLQVPAPLDAIGLQLVVARDRSLVFQALDMLLVIFLGIGTVIVGGVILFSRIASRHITQPLSEIAAAAEEIVASGRPVARLPTRRDDEFGRLAAAFNTMVDRLRESYSELENLVAERTRDYEESQQEAERVSKLLEEAVQSIAVGFSIYDENDQLVMCNEAFLQLYEDNRKAIVPGARFVDIVDSGVQRGVYHGVSGNPEDWIAHRVAEHLIADGTPIEQHLSNGHWLLIIEHRTPSGYIVGNRIDITEIKNAAQALEESEERFELAVSGANDGIWDWNPATGKSYFSQRWKAMLGYSESDISGDIEEWRSRVHPEDLERVLEGLSAHLRGQTDFYSTELRLRCKDGSYKWILSRGRAKFDEAGNPVRMSGSHTDITERRQAEARIHDRNEQLNAIFALSPDGFVSFDKAHRVKYASPAFQRMTGIDEARIVGLDEDAFSSVLAAASTEQARFPGMAQLRAEKMHGGREIPGGHHGTPRHLIEMASAGKRILEAGIRVANAESVSQILYLRDVTHETEVDRMKSEFLSTAAHELRTPMASIYGFSELMLHQEFSREEQADFLTVIYRQSELMISIINELLDLARIEARRGKDFVFSHLDARALLHDILANFRAPDARSAPRLAPGDGPCWIRADSKKLTQAVTNILSNAYKYSPQGGEVEIALITRPEGHEKISHFGIRITDHGIGMSPEQLARICERFYRADTSGKIPGTGLGMSIVQEITQLHGGELEFASHPGTGSTVVLWLPAISE